MASQQSEGVIKRLLSEENGSIDYKHAVTTLSEECEIAESTARQYIADSMVGEKDKSGETTTVEPGPHVSDDFGEKEGSEMVEKSAGDQLNSTFGSLPVLQDVNHPEVPTHAEHGYIRRRMNQPGDEASAMRSKTDIDVVTAAMADDDFATLLIGKHGVGKDHMVEHICAKTNRPMVRLVANDDPDFIDLLIGSYRPNEDGDFSHEKGLLTTAIENGYTFVLDEFNVLSGKAQSMLNKILEGSDSSEVVIPETNEVIEPHPEFNFVATMNPNEVGYGGREMLDQATSSRFIPIRIPPLSEDAERRVVELETGFNRDDPAVDKLLRESGGIVTGIRQLKQMGKTTMWVSTRDVIQVLRMAERIGSVEAATEMVLLGRAGPEDRETIRSNIQKQNW